MSSFLRPFDAAPRPDRGRPSRRAPGACLAIGQELDLEVCGDAENIQEALRQVEGANPDVVIIDLSLDGEDGIELIDFIKSRWPSVKILAYSVAR